MARYSINVQVLDSLTDPPVVLASHEAGKAVPAWTKKELEEALLEVVQVVVEEYEEPAP